MDELATMEDWGLQAVVRGCTTTLIDNQISCFGTMDIEQDYDLDLLFNFPDLFESTSFWGNELEELYKPFYPIFHTPLPPQTIIASSASLSDEMNKTEDKTGEKMPLCGSAIVSTSTTAHTAKYKRRKNQQKRVVLQVPFEGLSSDKWAWRKYGQKPIKGSPYPRSYYRCSSSKGCLARKQVEQSCSDPGMFIITYSAEHSHSQPTRRNSLAGTNRHRFAKPKRPTTADSDMEKTKYSPKSNSVLSPTTPLASSIGEVLQPPHKQQERGDDNDNVYDQIVEENEGNEFVIPDIMLSEDFFVGLEDLDGLTSDLAFYNCSTKQFPTTLCS